MSLIDRMDAAFVNSDAVQMRFSQRYARDRNTVFLFFEDLASQAFYLPSANRVFGPDARILCLPCANKSEVIAFKNSLSEMESAGAKVLFLVDRDYDDLTGEEQISTESLYVTDFYSIENYLVNSDLIRAVLLEGFCHTFGEDYTDGVVQEFEKMNEEFARLINPIMLVGMTHKYKKNGISFSNVKMNKMFYIDEEFKIIRRANAFEYFQRVACNSWQKVSFFDLAKVWNIAGKWSNKRQIRGNSTYGLCWNFLSASKIK